jgi:ribosomal protein S20
VETSDLPAAHERLRSAARLLQRAANCGPLHRNTAARIISRMQSRLAAIEKTAAK